MSTMRRLFCVLLLLFFIAHQAFSSSPSRLPSANNNKYTVADKTATEGSSNNKTPPLRSQSSAVTFLYELYEHEIYNPSTDSWTSRRFTQSPITGGGGRDSTSRKCMMMIIITHICCQMIGLLFIVAKMSNTRVLSFLLSQLILSHAHHREIIYSIKSGK